MALLRAEAALIEANVWIQYRLGISGLFSEIERAPAD
jgi:hypothetical protein